MNELNNRSERAEGRISTLEERTTEIGTTERKQAEKKENELSLWDKWNLDKRFNVCLTGHQKGRMWD